MISNELFNFELHENETIKDKISVQCTWLTSLHIFVQCEMYMLTVNPTKRLVMYSIFSLLEQSVQCTGRP